MNAFVAPVLISGQISYTTVRPFLCTGAIGKSRYAASLPWLTLKIRIDNKMTICRRAVNDMIRVKQKGKGRLNAFVAPVLTTNWANKNTLLSAHLYTGATD